METVQEQKDFISDNLKYLSEKQIKEINRIRGRYLSTKKGVAEAYQYVFEILNLNYINENWNYLTKEEKRKVKSGEDLAAIFKEKNCKIFYKDQTQILVAPLDYECAKFMDSFHCYGTGAKWCIGYEGGEMGQPGEHWDTYTRKRKSVFILHYSKISNEKLMIEYQTKRKTVNLWEAEDVTKDEGRPVNDFSQWYGMMDQNDKIIDFMPFFNELVKYSRENWGAKPDERIAALLNDPNYPEHYEHYDMLESCIKVIWKGFDEVEKHWGGRMDLVHVKDYQFELTTSHPELMIDCSGYGVGRYIGPRINSSYLFKSIKNMYTTTDQNPDIQFGDISDEQFANLPGNPIIMSIKCPKVILFDIRADADDDDQGTDDYGQSLFPQYINGDLVYEHCELYHDSWHGHPAKVTGSISFKDCDLGRNALSIYSDLFGVNDLKEYYEDAIPQECHQMMNEFCGTKKDIIYEEIQEILPEITERQRREHPDCPDDNKTLMYRHVLPELEERIYGELTDMFIEANQDYVTQKNIPRKTIFDYMENCSEHLLISGKIKEFINTFFGLDAYGQPLRKKVIVESLSRDELLKLYYKAEPYSKEHKEIVDQIKKLDSEAEARKPEKKNEVKVLIGDCRDVIEENDDFPWSDATELAQDFGFYANFDDWQDPEESNYEKISKEEFEKKCRLEKPVVGQNDWLYLKRYDDSVYCAYNFDDDIHYFYL